MSIDLKAIETKYQKLSEQMGDPSVLADKNKYREIAKEFAKISEIRDLLLQKEELLRLKFQASIVLKEEKEDPELRQMAEEEIQSLNHQLEQLEKKILLALIPPDPNDHRNVVLEIRAGAGGHEAALFAGELFRMYEKYVEKMNWKMMITSVSPGEVGGYKEIIAVIEGEGAFKQLKYERGVHRVQRVPITEAGGRIHTSTVTVAVLPEAEEVEVEINENDLRIDIFRATGPGGQGVNTTDSAVRITHLPTGIVVSCQDERSQLKNKQRALRVLRARLLEKKREEQAKERANDRRSQIGSGDRSEKIRTYNFPQGRVTDHRIDFTLYKLTDFLEGNIGEMIQKLQEAEQLERLELEAIKV